MRAELALAETVCALTRRLALAYSIRPAIDVAPAKQPDASLTRTRLLEQIDEEIDAAARRTRICRTALRRLRRGVVDFVNYYSMGGNGSVKLPAGWRASRWLSSPPASTARTPRAATLDLMSFNGITHPMFAPGQMVALNDGGGISMMTGPVNRCRSSM